MVIGSHAIFGAYGFWLPNDPRGSWSEFVGAWELHRAGGDANKVDVRYSVAGATHDRDARLATKERLRYPPAVFDESQRTAVAEGFGAFARRNGVTVLACAVMPEHVHLVVARHRYDVERLVNVLKGAATRELSDRGRHPMARFRTKKGRPPTCWARGEWKVFLEDAADVERAVAYVEANPAKDGLPAQEWPFVTDWRAWIRPE